MRLRLRSRIGAEYRRSAEWDYVSVIVCGSTRGVAADARCRRSSAVPEVACLVAQDEWARARLKTPPPPPPRHRRGRFEPPPATSLHRCRCHPHHRSRQSRPRLPRRPRAPSPLRAESNQAQPHTPLLHPLYKKYPSGNTLLKLLFHLTCTTSAERNTHRGPTGHEGTQETTTSQESSRLHTGTWVVGRTPKSGRRLYATPQPNVWLCAASA